MTQELAERTPLSTELQEKVLLGGDLSKLTPAERLSYYNNVCTSLDLNPLTRPFEYIVLNSKLTLYARKDCTEQLRTKHQISVTILSREVVEGVYIVTARAQTLNGRQDESIGAVPIANVQGNDRANAMMKAETKAKRRVTLSICGLGMLDETELETIKSARQFTPEIVTSGVPNIPDVRIPSPNAKSLEDHRTDALAPIVIDRYTGEPQQEDGLQGSTAPSGPPVNPARKDAPAATSGAELAKRISDGMDETYEDGMIGNIQPYQGTKAYQKGCRPGYFDLEDGQGGLVRKFKYLDPDMDISSGLKRVYYRTENFKGKTSYAVTKIEAID